MWWHYNQWIYYIRGKGIGREENNVSGNRDVPILDPKKQQKDKLLEPREQASHRVGNTLTRRTACAKALRQKGVLVITSQTFG